MHHGHNEDIEFPTADTAVGHWALHSFSVADAASTARGTTGFGW